MNSKSYRKKAVPIRTRYDRQATEQRILSTCVKLFLEQGFSNTPPKQIFEEADVSAGTFYHLYKAKSDVLKEFIGFMFSNRSASPERSSERVHRLHVLQPFGIAGKIIGKDASPVMLYAVETSIQLTLVELNENLREVYVEVYTQPDLLDLIHQHTTAELQKIFSSYLPKATVSDFYEIEIGTAGIMRSYMAHPCDVYFTLERKLERFLRTNLRIFEVPKEEIEAVIASVLSLDIRTIADDVMQQLFRALEMQYSFTLNKKSVFKTEE